jgi:hypothetical protein
LQRDPPTSDSNDQHYIFGVFFISIAISIALAAIITEIASINKVSMYYYPVLWVGSFAITFFTLFHDKRGLMRSLRSRIKNSIRWPRKVKVLNGICWAGPFAAIAIYPALLPYLVLVGIGLGNISTYLFLRKYNGINHREQLIVGLLSLAAIAVTYGMHTSIIAIKEDIAVMLSRIFVALAYAVGGIYAIVTNNRQ